jgi:hypothetical protein
MIRGAAVKVVARETVNIVTSQVLLPLLVGGAASRAIQGQAFGPATPYLAVLAMIVTPAVIAKVPVLARAALSSARTSIAETTALIRSRVALLGRGGVLPPDLPRFSPGVTPELTLTQLRQYFGSRLDGLPLLKQLEANLNEGRWRLVWEDLGPSVIAEARPVDGIIRLNRVLAPNTDAPAWLLSILHEARHLRRFELLGGVAERAAAAAGASASKAKLAVAARQAMLDEEVAVTLSEVRNGRRLLRAGVMQRSGLASDEVAFTILREGKRLTLPQLRQLVRRRIIEKYGGVIERFGDRTAQDLQDLAARTVAAP